IAHNNCVQWNSYELHLLLFQGNHSYFGPDTQPSLKTQKSETTVNIKVLAVALIKAGPLRVNIFYRAPLKTEKFNTELRAVRMACQSEIDTFFVLQRFGLPVRWVVRHQYFKLVIRNVRCRLG